MSSPTPSYKLALACAPGVRAGTLVRFAFPFTEAHRDKVRPCLVVALDHARQEVVVCYGSSRLYGAEAPELGIRLLERDEWERVGLHEPTRFQIDRRIRVALTSPRFRQGPAGEPPVLGHLAPHLAQSVADLYAALPALDPGLECAGVHPGPADKRRRPRNPRRRGRRQAA